jgi:hypothetical protein
VFFKKTTRENFARGQKTSLHKNDMASTDFSMPDLRVTRDEMCGGLIPSGRIHQLKKRIVGNVDCEN